MYCTAHFIQDPCFSPCCAALDSETRSPVWEAGKCTNSRFFLSCLALSLFLRSFSLRFCALFLASRLQARKCEKNAGTHLWPFRLSNAAQTFQHMMDRTVDGLEGVLAYMDASRVGSPNRQTHLLHLEAFLMLWPPMVSPSTLRNAFLQSPPWKFLATQFQRQDWPP